MVRRRGSKSVVRRAAGRSTVTLPTATRAELIGRHLCALCGREARHPADLRKHGVIVADVTTTAAVGLRSERGPILLAIMVTTGLVAIDATILATAVPTLVAELGSFELFPWLFSIYLLAQAVSTPLFAKFSDMVGRKPIILIGIGLFLIGSILCGLAWSMPALIAFRAVQGIGAGAIGPMAITIAGDIYSVEERAKVQGYIASVWAASAARTAPSA